LPSLRPARVSQARRAIEWVVQVVW
jgi:hypothetical protein